MRWRPQAERTARAIGRGSAGPFSGMVNCLSRRGGATGYGASLLKVFWPYLVWNTVFDNSRVVAELGGEAPAKFSGYAYPPLEFSRLNHFTYPVKPWPAESATAKKASGGAGA